MKKQVIIKAAPNNKKQTFTLRKYFGGKLYAKYRTVRLSKDDFRISYVIPKDIGLHGYKGKIFTI